MFISVKVPTFPQRKKREGRVKIIRLINNSNETPD